MRCIVCLRPLTKSASTAAHIGPVCLARLTPPKPKRQRVMLFDRRPAQEVDPRQTDWIAGATA